VLDEIDAALDINNVSRVAAYIRERTRRDGPDSFQSVVISLKDNFFEWSDALIGVQRDASLGCSSVITFDLDKFGAPGA
jgi:structural maintenance of chromosome 1